MSKYSTDEIIESLQSVMNVIYAEHAYEAIARLRAADALLSAAKDIMEHPIPDGSFELRLGLSKLRKAISAYEEERDGKV